MNKFKVFLGLCIVFLFTACNKNQSQSFEQAESSILTFSTDGIVVNGKLGNFKVDLQTQELENGLDLVTIHLHSDKPMTPPEFEISWKFPSVDIYKYWNPKTSVDKVNYYYNSFTSSATRNAPVISFMDEQDNNRFAFAIADGLNKVALSTELIEEDACFHCDVKFFEEEYPAISDYKTQILIDRRQNPFYQTLSDITKWWSKQDNYKPSVPPSEAKKPMYSTWYSYHQNLDVNKLIEECQEGKKIGLEAIIVDDGWQTMDNKRGYAYTGDWNPDRIQNMAEFVDRLHEIDMKILLWYSVPFVGKHAKNFDRFKGKYLYAWDSQGCSVLDPRYPEVREFIINTYEIAMKKWNLDGFKLDFMGFFKPGKDTDLTAKNGRDFASVNDAVDKLMTDIMNRLTTINPDAMIEFRQPYIGPLMRKYGNMLRAADCPNMGIVNKVRVTDIRLLADSSAVHSDMLMWHNNDPVESAALQILNVIFSVPQVSVRLNEVPQNHKDMIAFWIKYWNENNATLMDKGFYPKSPDALYPIIQAGDENKIITAVYQDQIVENDFEIFPESYDIINAKKSTKVVILNNKDFGLLNYRTYNCMGEQVEEGRVKFKEGSLVLNVPSSGLIKIRK